MKAPAERSDAEIVAQVRTGNVDAFGALVTKYRERYGRYAVRMLGNREDAEEALQDAFDRAFRNLDRLDDAARFGGWLFSILANRCRTVGRRRGRREQTFVAAEAAGEPGHAAEVEVLAWREEIDQALGALPADQREAFLLHHVEGWDYEEMADVTGAGQSALKMRVKRARERLVTMLGGAR
jgi:RNA polymerase sigma-70 factor (ECF subfamily)